MSNFVKIIERAIGRGATEASLPPLTDKERAHAVCAALYDAGFVITPVEPTDAMLEAAWRTVEDCPTDQRMAVLLADARTAHKVKMLNRYRAMIEAIPLDEWHGAA